MRSMTERDLEGTLVFLSWERSRDPMAAGLGRLQCPGMSQREQSKDPPRVGLGRDPGISQPGKIRGPSVREGGRLAIPGIRHRVEVTVELSHN